MSIALLYYGAAMLLSEVALAQTIAPQGDEFSVLESLATPGDQTFPAISLTPNGGYVVWQDNAIDGSSFGIAARYLDGSFSAPFGSFRVNQQGLGTQQRPQVAAFAGGGAAFVWQGGKSGSQNIFVRFLGPSRTFNSGAEVRVNVFTNGDQTVPAVAALDNSTAAIVWSSLYQDGSFTGVYARIVRTNGQFVGGPFQVNQFTANHQSNPTIALGSNGTFMVVWASEGQFGSTNVDIVGRIFNASGAAVSDEIRISTGTAVCATPAISYAGSGFFTIVWAQRIGVDANGWDIYARTVSAAGVPGNDQIRINTYTYGDQYWPRVFSGTAGQLVAWTSIGEDGSGDGVYGRLLSNGDVAGEPFLINSTTAGNQNDPAIGGDGGSRFLAVWAGFHGITNGFDLFGRRFSVGAPLPIPSAPFVSALGSSQLSITWPALIGYPLVGYEIYMNGSAPPNAAIVVSNATWWVKDGLAPGSTNSFALTYLFSGGIRSLLSQWTPAVTWGVDSIGPDGFPDGIPDDWERRYFGYKAAEWPRPSDDSDGDGVSNIREFLAGTDPTDSNSVLKMWFSKTSFGRRLNWNTQSGFIYQVQVSNDLNMWSNLGEPRFAAGATDSLAVGAAQRAEYFRVLRIR